MTDDLEPLSDLSRTDFWLGEALVCPERLTLTLAGTTARIEPRVMEILVCLAERGVETVSREQLRDTLWDAHVTDDAINRAVWKARRALGPHGALIETVSKRGYRLATPIRRAVHVAAEPAARPSVDSAVAGASSRRAGAVRMVAAAALLALAVSTYVIWHDRAGAAPPTASPAPADSDSDILPFTSMSGYESSPSISTDGQLAVFANYAKEGPDALQWDLYARPLHGGEPRRLTSTPAHEMNPALSPSGRSLAFVRLSDSSCGYHVLELADGAERDLGIGCGASRGPADCCPSVVWRGESHLLVTRRDSLDAPTRIYEVEVEAGAEPRMITDPPAQWFGDGPMALSPDGQDLALVRRRSPEIADLFVLSLPSGQLRQVTREGYRVAGVTWSQDGRSLLFGWRRTGTEGLWEIPAQGGQASPVATVGMNASGPATGPGVLLYEEWKSEINLWEVDPAAAVSTPLVVSTRWDWHGQRSPDGRRLAFVSNRDGDAEVWVADTGAAAPRRLTSLGSHLASAPRWAPDGAHLVVALPGTRGIDVALIDAASGAAEALVADASDDREPVFSGDGATVYFASNRSGGWNIWSVRRDGTGLRQWTRDGGVAARESFDGTAIWFVRPGAAGLWRLPLQGGAAERVVADFRPSAPQDWEVTAGGIYYTRHDADSRTWLSRLDPTTGRSVDLVQLDSATGMPDLFDGAGLWVAPDGSRVVVSSVDRSHSDLWLKRRRDS